MSNDPQIIPGKVAPKQLGKERERPLELPGLPAAIEKLFPEIDRNKDGALTRAEVSQAVLDKKFDKVPQASQVVALLHIQFEAIALKDPSSKAEEPLSLKISKRGLDVYKSECLSADKEEQKRFSDWWSTVSNRLEDSRSSKLFGVFTGTGSETDAISPLVVRQGFTGTCGFLSSLSSFAGTAEGKRAIQSMIKSDPNGNFIVTFPGAADSPITVASPTRAEKLAFAAAGKFGTWVNVLEKAYGEFRKREPQLGDQASWLEAFGSKEPPLLPQDAGGIGEHSGLVLSLLTNREFVAAGEDPAGDFRFASQYISVNKAVESAEGAAKLEAVLVGIAKQRAPSIASPRTAHNSNLGASALEGLSQYHAYSLLNYDSKSKLVTLRNPWGSGEPTQGFDGKDDGVFKLSLSDFIAAFAYVESSPKIPFDGFTVHSKRRTIPK